ncbi:proline-rich protein HaeIII subfamily 1 [Pteropus medius]|uniref:proline-rich protein HaeIII subfamily 1-like n=1 Tax=Pteropus vampyrus TaxID=132908 RepID=UPI00196B948E|nr:proline-rich protein HaeIII subfamily 1-like [Pteropus giganteus]
MGRILVHIKEEFTRRRGVIAREMSLGLSRASPQRPPPPPTAAGPERVKPREGALVPVPFLLRRQPEPEPGKAAAEHMGPETTAPPSPPGRVGHQQQRWEGDEKQGIQSPAPIFFPVPLRRPKRPSPALLLRLRRPAPQSEDGFPLSRRPRGSPLPDSRASQAGNGSWA